MQRFSYSKMNLFDGCPHAYKLKYIDKVKVERPQTIEQFTGKIAHNALEYLHEKIMHKKVPSLAQTLTKLEMQWNKKFDPNSLVINDQRDYKQIAFDAVENYHNNNYPFENDKTIAVEKMLYKEFDNFSLIGYVDRIEKNGDKYTIHDYKTGKRKYFDEKQLKIYHLLLDSNKEAELVWHFLFLNKKHEITSKLDGILNKIGEKINTIESEKNFGKKRSMRCNWCIFKDMCIT